MNESSHLFTARCGSHVRIGDAFTGNDLAGGN